MTDLPTADGGSRRASHLQEELERRLAVLPGLVRRPPSRRGHGFAFFFGSSEIAHFHGDHRIDVRLTNAVIRQRLEERGLDERVRVRSPSANWVALELVAEDVLPLAQNLVGVAMRAHAPPEEGRGSDSRELGPRVDARPKRAR